MQVGQLISVDRAGLDLQVQRIQTSSCLNVRCRNGDRGLDARPVDQQRVFEIDRRDDIAANNIEVDTRIRIVACKVAPCRITGTHGKDRDRGELAHTSIAIDSDDCRSNGIALRYEGQARYILQLIGTDGRGFDLQVQTIDRA